MSRSNSLNSLATADASEARPLIITADPEALDELLRLAASADVEVDVAPDAATARLQMPAAPLIVVVDDEMWETVVQAAGPRRPGIVLIGRDTEDASIWARAMDLGAEHVVFLPEAEEWLVARFARAAGGHAPEARPATVVCVIGGRGGAGTTTLAVALAVTGVRRGLRTLLVDADPLGGGIDLVVGAEHTEGLRWPDIAGAAGRVGPESLRQVLPMVDGLSVLSWDRGELRDIPPAAMRSALTAGCRGHELVVVDLARRVDEAARIALRASAACLLIVPAEVRASAAAARVASALVGHAGDLRVVVRGPAPGGLGAGHVSEALGLPLAGDLRPEPGLAFDLERGQPPAASGRGPLADFCRAFLDGLAAIEQRAA